jgi:linear primary-alkylsulfatase
MREYLMNKLIKVSIASGFFVLQACDNSTQQQSTASVNDGHTLETVTHDVPVKVVSNAVIAGDHFSKKGKVPSPYTIAKQRELRQSLPFDDKRDFDEVNRGFIAPPQSDKIMAEAGHVAWDFTKHKFLDQDKDFDSIHPSLQRVARLNMAPGLYEVKPGIYQVRGFDLSNISFVKGDTGWIIFDPLISKETAKAALELANKHLGERPVKAVIYSHSHADHFGGVRGVVDEEDVKSGKVQIIAPEGFMKHAVAENVYAGNAMVRRLFYQYGVLLPGSPYGHVDQSIGKGTSSGSTGLIAPNRYISKPIEELTIDGVHMVFQNTPGTEAPAEMNTWFPELNAFWAAENITGTIHNIYTLRGALVRDSLAWSKYINEALYRFGQDAEVMFASHSWPRWNNERIQEVMRAQRDMYGNMNNQVLFLANNGVTINEIQNVYEVPESLKKQWAARSYHGSVKHNVRGVLNRYLGYWDGNPATLIPLSPRDSAPLYVEMMGGSDKIIAKAQSLFNSGEYLMAQEIANKLVYAEPENQQAKDLLADIFEQIGYQQESNSVRNSFLAAALELRQGIPQGAIPSTDSPDVVRAMTSEMFFDFIGVRVDSKKAAGMQFVINLVHPDIDEKFVLEMSNATFTNIKGQQSAKPDLTITVNRSDMNTVMMGKASFDDLITNGQAKLDGDSKVFDQLKSVLGQFSPTFEMVPITKQDNVLSTKLNAFEAQMVNVGE